MSRFLFAVWPLSGHLHPNLAVALALRQRGHEVAFYSGERARGLLDREGIDLYPFQKLDEAATMDFIAQIGGAALALPGPWERKRLFRQWLVDSIPGQVSDLDRVVREWRPDVIVCDPAMWGSFLIVSELRNILVGILSYVAACLLPGPEGPVLGWSIPRPRTPLGWGIASVARAAFSVLSSDIPRAANRMRQSYGLPKLRMSVNEYAGTLPLYLMPSSPEFDYNRRDLPPSVWYVGPCVWDHPSAEPPPKWLADIPIDRPLVYVTEGTFQLHEPFLIRAAIQGLADSATQVVATTGRDRDPSQIGLDPFPPNVRVERFVPLSLLFAKARVVVTTGGSGTVTAALCAGIPLVVVPTAWDQPENAWRISDSGAGIRLSVGDCTPVRIRDAVQKVLSDPNYRHNARRLGESLSRRGGALEAALALETLFRPPRNLENRSTFRKDVEETA